MTSIAAKMPFSLDLSEETKRLLNWLLIWVVLANIGFMSLWFVGAPPRYDEIVAFAAAGLVVKRFGFWVRIASFIGAMVYSGLSFVSALFNLGIPSLFYSLRFFAEIEPANSIEYIFVAIGILIVMAATFRLMRRDTNFSATPHMLAAGLICVALAGTDFQISKGMRGHYNRSAPEGAAFASARSNSGFAAAANGKRHLVLIMVESLGVPRGNAEMDRLLFRDYKSSAAIRGRYEISQGTSPYYKSTTSGEVRELCGRWGDYYELLETTDPTCLPAKLARQGYATHAMHSFTGDFFSRAEWYPNIGFESREFEKDIIGKGALFCGGVFAGACDRDVPRQMAAHLKAAKKPTFLYWLTLNSHLPVPPGQNLNVDKCERISPVLAKEFPQICRQFSIFHDVDTAVIREITAQDFPEADILIVGDHMPPYFDRHHRSQFDPENVPWIYLKYKDPE